MGIHKTEYRTENGKTRKIKKPAGTPAATGANGAAETGADSPAETGGKNNRPGNPGKQGANQ